MIGGHVLKGWGSTQHHVTFTAAEVEVKSFVAWSAELLGVSGMMKERGADGSGVVYADTSAALAVIKRAGAGDHH